MTTSKNTAGLDPAGIDALARDPKAPRAKRMAARAALRERWAAALAAAKRRVEVATARFSPEARASASELRPAAPSDSVAPVIRSTDFSEIAAEYEAMFADARPLTAYRGEIEWVRQRILKGGPAYRAAAGETGAPWAMIGLIHALEAGFDFSRHLHNGDPLSARTRRVPAGRPASGAPPFSWEESAVDALRGHGLHRIADWSLARTLYELERYNGFGYRHRGAPSPYLWSFSDRYRAGKYVKDGVYDPEAVSRQAGAATVLKAMIDAGDIAAPG